MRNLTKKTGLALTISSLFLSAHLSAQSAGTGSSAGAGTGSAAGAGTGAVPSNSGMAGAGNTVTGQNANAGTMNQGLNSQVLPTNQNIQNTQNTRGNTDQGNPNSRAQNQGVFGPSNGPGVFGPTNQMAPANAQPQTTVTDIYGNQQPVSGSVQQAVPNNNNAVQRAQPTISYDANGQPIPSTNNPRGTLPRDQNPITPNPATQTAPSSTGSVTGR